MRGRGVKNKNFFQDLFFCPFPFINSAILYFLESGLVSYLRNWHLEENVDDGDGVHKPVEDVEDRHIVGLLAKTRGSLNNQTKSMVHQDVSRLVKKRVKNRCFKSPHLKRIM